MSWRLHSQIRGNGILAFFLVLAHFPRYNLVIRTSQILEGIIPIERQSSMSTISCDLNCENGGYCSLYPFESSLVTSIPVDGSLHQLCVCPLGYTGLTCSEPTQELESCHEQDGTNVCRHGGLCREIGTSSNQSSEWVCDCGIADQVNAFAGAMCRQPATEYCNMSGSSFCTNGGTCVSNLVYIEFAVPGECICPPEFTGPHCEFLKVLVEKQRKPHSILESEGVKPQEHGSRPDRNNYVPLLLLGLVSITTLIFSIWWRKKNKSNHVHNQVTHGRHLNHPSSVFPLSPLGYTSDNNFYHDGESDDEFSFQDVALT